MHGQLGQLSAPLRTLADVHMLDSHLPAIARSIALPDNQLVAKLVSQDTIGGSHVFYDQVVNGLKVVDGRVVVHIQADGQIAAVGTNTRDLSAVSATPALFDTVAITTAINAVANGDSTANKATLVYMRGKLAWEVEATATHVLQRDKIYVDATTGDILARLPQIESAKNRVVYTGADKDIQDQNFNPTLSGNEGTPPTEAYAKDAFDNTGITYDFYKNTYNRDSFDNAGAELDSYVHLTLGNGYANNAYWDGQEMVYGNGDGVEFGPFARSLDITAHELTHAVTERTAGLEYQDESGALNEASSDIMSAACEADHNGGANDNTWKVGEDTYTPNTPGDALRYMNNPTADAVIYNNMYSSADYYPEKFVDTNNIDNGGVHFNSGIANLYFYLLSEGGKHPRNKTPYMNAGIGIIKANAVWEEALTQGYFMSTTNFASARTATENAATALFANQPAIKTAVSTAWASVGVGAAPPADTTPPTVHIDTPTDGSSVQAGFAVSATATDDQGVLKVEFSVDGVVVGTSNNPPYTYTTKATLAPGSHMVAATAYDTANHASDSVTVTIIDPTCGNACTADQTCNMTTGMCENNNNNNGDDTGGGGGCCSTSGGGAGGSTLLFAATGAVLLRRRKRAN
ncbi:MAG: M4 family metallopeptidase [Kofleriaceae bacterium]